MHQRSGRSCSFNDRSQTLEAVLDQMPQPTILCDCNGRLVYANSPALYLMERSEAIQLCNRVLVTSDGDAGAFRAAIGKACDEADPRAEAVFIRQAVGPPLLISTAPVREADGSRWALVLISVINEAGEKVIGRLQSLFSLSKAEAEIVLAIGNGSLLQNIADQRQVSLGTVRSQLKSAASKLGCSRQAEIAVLVNALGQSPSVPEIAARPPGPAD